MLLLTYKMIENEKNWKLLKSVIKYKTVNEKSNFRGFFLTVKYSVQIGLALSLN